MPSICPFCEHVHPDRDHFIAFHRDRIRASAVYAAQLAAGAGERAAQRAANMLIWHRGPGMYDRQTARA